MKGRVLVTLAAVVLVFSLFSPANAQQLSRVVFNGWTQVQIQGTPPAPVNRIAFIVYVTFNPAAYAPDFVKHIKITAPAPDGSVFYLYPNKDWLTTDQAFYKNFLATDFKSGKIPGGLYKATVVPVSGTAITETDSIAASFITVPTITYPTPDLTGVPARPTFEWTAVSGATFYRVVLWNDYSWEPIFNYYIPQNNLQTDLTYAKVPKGALKPDTRYKLQIQARGDSNDMDRRSQTGWVYFTTGSW